ncbi:MAG: SMI1/KNR4 family protein [Treponema sp.]|jgi:hypothetical protein|nr:SMI1/KNR4 family protein [Treponema sp.]
MSGALEKIFQDKGYTVSIIPMANAAMVSCVLGNPMNILTAGCGNAEFVKQYSAMYTEAAKSTNCEMKLKGDWFYYGTPDAVLLFESIDLNEAYQYMSLNHFEKCDDEEDEIDEESFQKYTELIEQYSKKGDFFGEVSVEAIQNAEAALGVKFPNEYWNFIRSYGSGGICGVEITGVEDDEASVVKATERYRKLGLDKNIVVVWDVGEFIYCMDTSQEGSVVYTWDRNDKDLIKWHDSFNEFVFDVFDNAVNDEYDEEVDEYEDEEEDDD